MFKPSLYRTLLTACLALLAVTFVTGCDDDDDVTNPEVGNPEEVITTVNLTFTPMGGGAPQVFQWRDADGDGGNPPTIDSISLSGNTTYSMTIDLLNETVPPTDPEYNIGDEIAEEAEEHQFFFGGTMITNGIFSHTYDDMESDYSATATAPDLPVGIANMIAVAPGANTGTFRVQLQHMPPVNGNPVKTQTATSNTGETDIAVEFNVTTF